MYEIIDMETGEIVAELEEPRYVYRSPKNGVWLRCNEEQAECVSINGRRYSIRGKASVADAPVADIRRANLTEKFKALAEKNAERIDNIEELRELYADMAGVVCELVYYHFAEE